MKKKIEQLPRVINVSNGSVLPIAYKNDNETYTTVSIDYDDFIASVSNDIIIPPVENYGVISISNQTTGEITYYTTLQAAKIGAVSGDTVHVYPQTITYDNTALALQNSGFDMTTLNLWKNGVTWYFEPGVIIIFKNDNGGEIMNLFLPESNNYTECYVKGYLIYEQSSTDAGSGSTYFFNMNIVNDFGYKFDSTVFSLKSSNNELLYLYRPEVLTYDKIADINITCKYIYKNYTGGNVGSGSTIQFLLVDSKSNITINFGTFIDVSSFPFYTRGNFSNSTINVYCDNVFAISSNSAFCFIRSLTGGTVNFDINKIYYTAPKISFGHYGSILSEQFSSNCTINLNAKLIDYVANTIPDVGIFHISGANIEINFTGDIITNTTSGNGRFIASIHNSAKLYHRGNIYFNGSGLTTLPMFNSQTGGYIEYSGNIRGNYNCAVVNTYNGTTVLNNCRIISVNNNSTSRLYENTTVTTGKLIVKDSYISLKNSTNPICKGNYINVAIYNSQIHNSVGDGLSGVTSGILQIFNSIAITSTNSINYSAGTIVNAESTTVNNNPTISTLNGSITVNTSLIEI